ncbi:MAG: zf-TFIIB domain-containing protein [Nitrospiria bacterium]
MEGDLKKLGYNKEEEYFYKLNKTLLEKMKKRDKAARAKKGRQEGQKEEGGKCPKCGFALEEIEPFGVRASRCTNCVGAFLSNDALEFLLEAEEPKGFLRALLRPPQ